MNTKPGYQTTEFWAVVGAMLAAVLGPLVGTHGDQVQQWASIIGGVAACLAAACYALARAFVKRG